MVALHECHLREFLSIWRQAQQAGVSLPAGGGDDYRSLETLLSHVLGAAGSCLVWCHHHPRETILLLLLNAAADIAHVLDECHVHIHT